MSSQGIDFSQEQEMPVYYKNNQIGMRLVDFLIHGIIAIELKEINYLEASDLDSKKNQNNPGIKWITVQTIMIYLVYNKLVMPHLRTVINIPKFRNLRNR